MAERCGACGSADTSTGGRTFSCLDCGAQTAYAGLAEQGVTADAATYWTDPAESSKATQKES